MAISGHQTDSIFRRYDIVSHQDIQHAGEKLSRYLLESAPKEDAEIASNKDTAQVHAG